MSCTSSPSAATEVVVDLTGVDEIFTLSFGSTRSCHLRSYAPTSPSNLFHPDGTRSDTPLCVSP